MLRTLVSVSEIVYQVSRHRAFNSMISLHTPVGIPQADSGVGLGQGIRFLDLIFSALLHFDPSKGSESRTYRLHDCSSRC